jgi:hypothetical protein
MSFLATKSGTNFSVTVSVSGLAVALSGQNSGTELQEIGHDSRTHFVDLQFNIIISVWHKSFMSLHSYSISFVSEHRLHVAPHRSQTVCLCRFTNFGGNFKKRIFYENA